MDIKRKRSLSDRSLTSLVKLLSEGGLSSHQIDRGLDYAAMMGAATMRQGYELAMSRALYSDAELDAGQRFGFD